MKNYLEVFNNYIKENYNLKDEAIMEKCLHSVRVAKLMLLLAQRLGLNEDDRLLAFKIGLCHDLGRFHEVVRNQNLAKKFNNLTFDHGAYSNKILFEDNLISEFDVEEEDYAVIQKALYYHNKKDLDGELDDREKFFCQMIRDMDKLDILYMRSSIDNEMKCVLPNKQIKPLIMKKEANPFVLYHYMHDKTIDLNEIHNQTDSVILYLSFIKDLALNESYHMAKEYGCLEKLVRIIDVSKEQEGLLKELLYKIKEKERISQKKLEYSIKRR